MERIIVAPQVQKIAVLGGGIGALGTVFALTSKRGWRKRYEITVYQMGWRLGGKGASGRNQEGDKGERIEEHGFHVWMGFYDNAFKMIRQCYTELGGHGPFKTWKDAFKKHSYTVMEEEVGGQRKRWQIQFPTGPREPGTRVQFGLLEYAVRMWRLLVKRLPPAGVPEHTKPHVIVRVWRRVSRPLFVVVLLTLVIAQRLPLAVERALERRLDSERKPGKATIVLVSPVRRLFYSITRTLRHVIERISRQIAKWASAAALADPDEARRLTIFFDLGLSVIRGIVVDDIMDKGFDSIDHLEFKDWLRMHNAAAESIDSALVDAIYKGNFSFTGGDPNRPNFAAGVALHCFLRIFLAYKGALMYKMQAGMGDVVIAPLYLVLKRRGVQFKFFHKVERLAYDSANNRISEIHITEQVALADTSYDPIVTVDTAEGALECWPSTPKYELIQNGNELRESGINLESQWAHQWRDSRRLPPLKHGEDYDLVVLGISVGAFGTICRELVEQRQEWRDMIVKVDTVATQAMQLWLTPKLSALGWPLPSPLLVNYEDPEPNWLDSTQVHPYEKLPSNSIGTVAYFCSALKDPETIPRSGPNPFPELQLQAVKQTYEQWLRQHAGYLWPAAVTQNQPTDFRWDLLYDPQNRSGVDRLNWQYFRANLEPSERFVLSSVGSTPFRLRPDRSGVRGLYLAGDWTRNGFNSGCVEATVVSGLQCSRAIAGYPQFIIGERPFGIGLGS